MTKNSKVFCEDCGEKRTDEKYISGYCATHLAAQLPAKTDNYSKIRAACQKANPKLMELTRGCALLDGRKVYEILSYSEDLEVFRALSTLGVLKFFPKKMIELNKTVEILGHEPALQDVLLVIGQHWQEDFSVGINGNVLNMGFVKEIARCGVEPWAIIISYDLTKPLKEQSPEVLQFIADLL